VDITSRNPRSLECAAGRVVEAVTDLRLRSLPEIPDKWSPDFEICDIAGRRIGVMEVTSTISSERAHFEAAKAKQSWDTPGLAHSWLVSASLAANPRKLKRDLPALLAEREHQGLGGTSVAPQFGAGDSTLVALAALDVQFVAPFDGRSPCIVLNPAPYGGFPGPSDVVDDVTKELVKTDNLSKLRTAGPGERAELFVWLADTVGSLAIMMLRLAPGEPDSGPSEQHRLSLPEGVTRVWAAAGPWSADTFASDVWYADNAGWHVVDAVPSRQPD